MHPTAIEGLPPALPGRGLCPLTPTLSLAEREDKDTPENFIAYLPPALQKIGSTWWAELGEGRFGSLESESGRGSAGRRS